MFETWMNRNIKRLNLGGGGGGGGKMEYLFGGALAVIILGALGITFYTTIWSSGAQKGDGKAHLKCTNPECGYEFTVDTDELPREEMQQEAVGDGTFFWALDCPSCGAKRSAIEMQQCVNPDCKKYYLNPRELHQFKTHEDDPEIRDKCPYCGTDRIEWYRTHLKR